MLSSNQNKQHYSLFLLQYKWRYRDAYSSASFLFPNHFLKARLTPSFFILNQSKHGEGHPVKNTRKEARI